MGGTQGGYLWQMGDADHLSLMTAHLMHNLRHLLGYLTADTRIYLVEDDCRQFHGTADHCLQGEHHTGNLTARGHLRYRLEWGRGIGGEEVGHLVLPVCSQVLLRDADLEPDIGHAQGYEPLLHLGLDLLGGFRA